MPIVILWSFLLTAMLATRVAGQDPAAGKQGSQQPQVKVNMLNVCAPSAEEQKEIASALGRVPKQPLFGTDFEVSRGRSTLTEMPAMLEAGGARARGRGPAGREFAGGSPGVFPGGRFSR